MKQTLLILAAGMASRYGSLKQIDAVGPCGETLIDYSIYDAIRAGFDKVVFVISKSIERKFREIFGKKLDGKIETKFVRQELGTLPVGVRYASERKKPWGTAHAVWVAHKIVKGPFVVINADDFYGPGSYLAMADYLGAQGRGGNSKFCMMGYRIGQTLSNFGSVSRGICEFRDENFLTSVVERTEIAREGQTIHFVDENQDRVSLRGDELVSMNIWGFTPSVFEHLKLAISDFMTVSAGQLKAELYVPTVVNDLVARGKASVKVLPAVDQWFGMTYREDKPLAITHINRLIEQRVYPDNLWGL